MQAETGAASDVVVVGAGLAGLVCARQLARQGLRVALLDRKACLREAIPTTGIFVRRTLEDFDLPADCVGPPIRHVTLYSPARRALELESSHPEFRIGRMGALYERYLERCLLAGVTWLPATHYLRCEPHADGVAVHARREGRDLALRARFVVGADGPRSAVARDLGLDQNCECIVGAEEVLQGIVLEGPPRLHCFLDPARAPGYIAWLAHDGEEAHLGVAGYSAQFHPAAALEQLRLGLKGRFNFERAVTVERRGGLIPVGGVLRRITGPLGLLVGDAAGAPSPLTAGGLDPCFRLSYVAAEVIGNYLQTGDPAALEAYSGARFRRRFVTRLWMRRLLGTVRSPWLVEAGFLALRLALHSVAWHIFFGRNSFPDASGVRWQSSRSSRQILP